MPEQPSANAPTSDGQERTPGIDGQGRQAQTHNAEAQAVPRGGVEGQSRRYTHASREGA